MPINIIGSLVSQLCLQSGFFPPNLVSAYSRTVELPDQESRPTFSELKEALRAFAGRQKTLMLIDAVDESADREVLLDFIAELTDVGPFNILFTSREEEDITSIFSAFPHLRLESQSDLMGQDIQAYVKHRLRFDRKLHWLNDRVKDSVASELNAKSAGM